MRKLKYLIASILLLLILGISRNVQADSVNFSVTPVLGANQTNDDLGYFNLLLQPNESQSLQFKLANSSNQTIKVNTSFGTAYTSASGSAAYDPNAVKPDPSLKINLKDYVKLPAEVSIPAKETVIVSAQVKMPSQNFKGVIAGGFNFEEDQGDQKASTKQKGLVITNNYRYVIGLVMQESMDKVVPELSLGKVTANQVNERNVITAHLTNSAMSYLMNMNTDAVVTKKDDSKVKYTYDNSMMEMAPNSNFNLAIPVSLPGVLNGRSSEPLKPGKYHLHMTVYGQKADNGEYQDVVKGKVVKYDYRWVFDKDFTITGQKASQLNAKDPTVQKPNWFLYIAIAVIIVLLLTIIFLLLKRRKKDEEEGTAKVN